MRYEIKGEPMPVAVCRLEAGETLICESGAMCWMSPNLVMQTGGTGKLFSRFFSGENLFQNRYTAKGGPGLIAVGSSYAGSIRAVQVSPGRSIVAQKRTFLAAESGVELNIFFQKKLGTAIFGGEGFIMQKISGSGTVLLEIDGSAVEYELGPGEQMIVDTGHLAMMDETVSIDIQRVQGVKNILLGGKGLFNTVLTGPGRIVLQTMPMSAFASLIASLLPTDRK